MAATTVASGGILQPGSGGQGKLQINGSLAFQSGALYLVQVTSSGAAFANVTGTATLTGAGVQVASGNNTFKFNTPVTVLTSGGLGGSTFSSLTMPAGITGSLGYTGTAVTLNMSSSLGSLSGLNANQKAVGNALDTAFNAPGASTGALGAIFSGNVAQNLTQAAGETSDWHAADHVQRDDPVHGRDDRSVHRRSRRGLFCSAGGIGITPTRTAGRSVYAAKDKPH